MYNLSSFKGRNSYQGVQGIMLQGVGVAGLSFKILLSETTHVCKLLIM